MTDIEQEVLDLTTLIASVRLSSKDCVRKLRDAPTDDLRYLVAERLPALGSMILPDVLDILADAACPHSLRYLAAWVALVVGDRDKSIVLMRAEVLRNSEWSLPAANALARHKIAEARREIAAALDQASFDRDNPDVAQYSAALRDVGGSISPTTRERIVKENDSWIARAVRQDFPSETT